MAKTLAILSGGAAALAAAGTALFLLKETELDLEVLALLGWVVGPYALFVLLAWFARRSAPAQAVVFLGVLVSAAFAAWAIYDAFKPPRASMAGLVFIVIPIYQAAALGASALVAGAILWGSRRSSPGA